MAAETKEVELSPKHKQVLIAWADTCEDFGCLTFDAIASSSGVARPRIRRIVRHLARKGMTEFYQGLWTEDMRLAGSGYAITLAGRLALATQPPSPQEESRGEG